MKKYDELSIPLINLFFRVRADKVRNNCSETSM